MCDNVLYRIVWYGIRARGAVGMVDGNRAVSKIQIAPKTSEDREYLRMLYEENAEHARKHEELRGAATAIFMALIAGLLAFAVGEGTTANRELVSGCLIFGSSLVGALVSYKHYERYELHLNRLRGFRSALELGLTKGLAEIGPICRKEHKAHYRFTYKWLKLHVLWLVVYGVTLLIGAVLVTRGLLNKPL